MVIQCRVISAAPKKLLSGLKQTLCVLALLSLSNAAYSQESSDIWVGKLNLWEKEPIKELVKITNNDQYSNQPYFFDNDRLFYTQALPVSDTGTTPISDSSDIVTEQDVSVQMDSWMFDFTLGKPTNITESAENEYSPTPVPGSQNMSVIKVNAEGKQELWQLDTLGHPLKHLAPSVEPVGYHVWLNKNEVLLFVLGEPNTLQRIDAQDPSAIAQTIDNNIGASLYRFEKTDWFLYTSHNDGNYLNGYNIRTQKVIQIVSMPKNSEYFSISPMGNVITSDGNKLWQRKFMVKGDKIKSLDGWREIKIKQKECAKGISRTSISPDTSMIALVCART
jgi:hypothetical protein